LLARDAGALVFHHPQDFRQGNHAGVPRCRHREGAMRRAAFDGKLGAFVGEKAINQARGERISAAYSIVNFKILAFFGLLEIAIAIADGAPIVSRGGLGFAKRSCDHLEGIVLHDLLDHLLEAHDFEVRETRIDSGDFVAKRR